MIQGGTIPGLARITAVVAAGLFLASCAAAPHPGTGEHFSESAYGVKASPRVASLGDPVPKGGGRYMVGKPYRVAGKTYVPRDNPRYSAVGLASWYGSAFHGRKTANGEVYDMKDLTAAHPTLPLPSYVRVTNLGNGRSVVVRVNDRGPYARNRLIDVSSTVAEVLDFKRAGTARVKVDYVGPAPMDGRDRATLLASYHGPAVKVPGMMIASAPKPASRLVLASATPKPLPVVPSADEPMALVPASLPADDPLGPLILRTGFASSYLPVDHFSKAQAAATTLAEAGDAAAKAPSAPDAVMIQIGTFSDPLNAKRIGAKFARFGSVTLIDQPSDGRTLRIVRVLAVRATPDAIIKAAADAGLAGAFVVAR